jgi:hypothetical protein
MNHLNAKIQQNRLICLTFNSLSHYIEMMNYPEEFRAFMGSIAKQWPELFPPEFFNGYLMKDIRPSTKLSIPVRRIKISGISYTVRPSFVMPYMTGFVNDVEKGLFLGKFDTPFGHYRMSLEKIPCIGFVWNNNPLAETVSLAQP